MRIKLGVGDTITAVCSGAKTSVDPKVLVRTSDFNGDDTAWVALNGVTAVTLATGLNSNDFFEGLTLLNNDTGSITVTLKQVIGGTGYTFATYTLAVGEKLIIDSERETVLNSTGNVKLAFASSVTTFTGDVTLSDGKDLIFSGTTGQSEIHVPDNLADALSMKIAAGADLITWDTSTGAVVVSFGASVRVNVLGSAQIGNATTDLVAFHGATPTDQCGAYTQTFSTADRTHAARTATALTVADGAGTNDGTIGAITGDASVIAAVQELAAAVNALIVDLADTAGVVNALVDDLQEKGLVG